MSSPLPDSNKSIRSRDATFAIVGSPGVGGPSGTRVNSRIALRAAAWLPWNARGGGDRGDRRCGGGYKLQPLLLQSRTAPPIHRSAASRPRGARASRCERRRPTIVYEMIMVARYEVAGSREAVRHLDWPVGSYKRRVARADDAIMRCNDGVDVGSWGAFSFVGRCLATAVVGRSFEFMTALAFSRYSLPK